MRDVKEHSIRQGEMNLRLADAIRRGKAVSAALDRDLFTVDYHELADRPVAEACEILHFPGKSSRAEEDCWPGVFDRDGMSVRQQQYFDARQEGHA